MFTSPVPSQSTHSNQYSSGSSPGPSMLTRLAISPRYLPPKSLERPARAEEHRKPWQDRTPMSHGEVVAHAASSRRQDPEPHQICRMSLGPSSAEHGRRPHLRSA